MVAESVNVQYSELLIKVEEAVCHSLMGEVYTTPKPGLVDQHDTGAHRDMDVNTFALSTRAISPYILQMFYCGYLSGKEPEEVFQEIRQIGICAEAAMFRATSGVNTHKGLIFTMGILAAATGICIRKIGVFDLEMLSKLSKEMTERQLTLELRGMEMKQPLSHGEKLYQKYGEAGIRGEAIKGFPVLMELAYPCLKHYREMRYNHNLSNINVLLHVMTELNDTNILSRGTEEDLNWIKGQAEEILRAGGAFSAKGYRMVQRMNEECVEKNLSPGGAADMLAAALFLYEMEKLLG